MTQGELHAERKAADLPPELTPTLARRADFLELAEYARRVVGIDEHRRDHHRPAVAGGDLLQPWHSRGHALGEHEHALADFAKRTRQLHQLVLVGEAGRHRDAVFAVVLLQRRGREADRTGAQRVGHDALSCPRPRSWWRRVWRRPRPRHKSAPRSDRRTRPRLAPGLCARAARGIAGSFRSSSRHLRAAPPAACLRRASGCAGSRSRSFCRQGAMVKPQLPITTLVTPSATDGVAKRSHRSWASKCVWRSMMPGASARPRASHASARRTDVVAHRRDATVFHRHTAGLGQEYRGRRSPTRSQSPGRAPCSSSSSSRVSCTQGYTRPVPGSAC